MNRRKGPVPREKQENKGTKFFLTLNYVQVGIELLHEDCRRIREGVELMAGPDGCLHAAMFWEERGLTTGNPHLHGILVYKSDFRTRCAAVANALCDTLGLAVRPHVEPCKDIVAAVAYRDKASKKEAWVKWNNEPGAVPFFGLMIHRGALRARAPEVLALTLGELWNQCPAMRSWSLNIPISQPDAATSHWTIFVTGRKARIAEISPRWYGYTAGQAQARLS